MKRYEKQIGILLVLILVLSPSPISGQSHDIQGHWAQAKIMSLQGQGYLTGYGDGNFFPDQAISRAEFVAAVNKIMGYEQGGEPSFWDISPRDWFWRDIAIGVKHGYIKGLGDGSFGPHRRITRLEAAVILARVKQLPLDLDPHLNFKDRASIPAWAKAQVAAVAKAGLMQGYADNTFGASQNISRAEAVVAIDRAKSGLASLAKLENKKDQAQAETGLKSRPKPQAQASHPHLTGGGPSLPNMASHGDKGPSSPGGKAKDPAQAEEGEGKEAEPSPDQDQAGPGGGKKDPAQAEEGEGKEAKPSPDQDPAGPGGGKKDPAQAEEGEGKEAKPSPDQDQAGPGGKAKDPAQAEEGEGKKAKPSPDQDQADFLARSQNKNTTSYQVDGQTRTILWVKGINPPHMSMDGTGDFKKEVTKTKTGDYIDYKAPFISGQYWYDVNKATQGLKSSLDFYLCYAAVASNMVHWWLDQNADYLDRYIQHQLASGDLSPEIKGGKRDIRQLINSFTNQQQSEIFAMYTDYYGGQSQGFYADLLIDLFINGYDPKENGGVNDGRDLDRPHARGGFFFPVFGTEILSQRMFTGSYMDFSRDLTDSLAQGKIVGLEHSTGSPHHSHIVTLWGAEYDQDGRLTGIYISDSDDNNEPVGMRRYSVRNVGGRPKISTNETDIRAGGALYYMHTLSLGQDSWEKYFQSLGQGQNSQVEEEGQDLGQAQALKVMAEDQGQDISLEGQTSDHNDQGDKSLDPNFLDK